MADELIFKLTIKTGDADKQISTFQKKLRELEKDMKNVFSSLDTSGMKKAFDDMSSQAEKAFDGGAFAKRIGNSMKDGFSSALSGIGSFLYSGFKTIVAGIVDIAITGFTTLKDVAGDAIDTFAEFQVGQKAIQKTSGATAEELDALGDSLRKAVIVDLKGARTVEELQAIAASAAKFGIEASKLDTFSVSVAKMSSAWDMTAEATGTAAAKIIAQYKLIPEQIENVGSAIDAMADSFAVNEPYVLNFAQRVSGAANLTGQSMADIAATAAVVSQETGMAAEAASSSYSKILMQMMNNSAVFAETLGGDVATWQRLITEDGTQAFTLLLTKLDELGQAQGPQAVTKAIKELGLGSIRTQQLLLGMVGSQEKLTEAAEEANLAFEDGTRISDNFAKTLEGITPGANQMHATFDEFLRMMGERFGPSVETVYRVFNEQIIPIFMEFRDWLLKSEEASLFFEHKLPAAVVALADALVEAVYQAKEFAQSVDWSMVLNSVGSSLESVANLISDLFQAILTGGDSGKTTLEGLKDSLSGVSSAISSAADAASAFYDVWKMVKSIISSVMDAAQPMIDVFVNGIDSISRILEGDFKGGIDQLLLGMQDGFSQAFTNIAETITSVLKSAIEGVTSWASDKIAGIMDKVSGIWEKVKSAASAAKDAITGAEKATKATEEATKDLETATKETDHATKDLEETATGHSTYPEMLDALKQVSSAQEVLSKSIGETTGQVRNLGIEAYGHSTYPEMMKYIDSTALNSKTLEALLRDTTQTIEDMGTAAEQAEAKVVNATSLSSSSGSSSSGFLSSSDSDSGSSSGDTTSNTTTTTSTTSVSINFSGTNIVDESSKDRFTTEISNALNSLESQTVVA